MEKVNIFSVFIFNPFRRLSKKYLLFFFMTIAILLCYGFFFTRASAEDEVITPTEVSEVSEVPTTITTEEVVINDINNEAPVTEVQEKNVVLDNVVLSPESPLPVQDFLDITVSSDSPVEISKEILPGSSILYIPAVDKDEINIVFNNLPDKDLYFYIDSLEESLPYSPNTDRSMTFSLGGKESHLIFIKSQHSTKTISNDATGGDCSSFGTWDQAALTCVMTKDVSEVIEIVDNGITLDGNGHMVKWSKGMGIGSGINISSRRNITVKNLIVEGFDHAFGIFQTSNSVFINNETRGFGIGFYLSFNDSYNIIDGNIITATAWYLPNVKITGSGIYLGQNVQRTTVRNNTISGTNYGLAESPSTYNNKVYNNNFMSTPAIYYNGSNNYIYQPMPIGGNYYRNYDTPEEGCNDINNDFICDDAISFSDGTDNFPWIYKNGWKGERVLDDKCTINCFSNVLFIPGLEASRLYKQKTILDIPVEDQLWEPNNNADVKDLYLNGDGTSVNPDIYTRDIIRETNTPIPTGALGLNIYKTFADHMTDMVDKFEIADWKQYAYDWRQGVEDIVNNGTQYQDKTVLLVDTLQSLVDSSKTKKVTIIAHSNGGLIAKALLKKLQEDKIAGKNNLIDSVDVLILVAVPEIGTASAVPAILHGYDQRILGGLLMREMNARELGRNMEGAYGLLPSREYMNRVSASPVTFVDNIIPSSVTTKLVETFGNVVDSYSEYKDFLFGGEGRVDPISSQTKLPIILSENLFTKAENLHNSIDAFTPPESLRVVEVAGWGLDTVASFEYYPKYSCYIELLGIGCKYVLDEKPRFTSDGDKTVVVPSAHYMGFLGNAEKYWVDLRNNNTLLRFNRDHKDILEVNSLNNLIKSLIKNEDITFDTVLKNVEPVDNSNRLRLSIHSPVTMDAYDVDGNHTGKICSTDSDFCYIEESITNSSYMEFGEGKYINLPEDQLSKVKLQGADIGTFTYESEKVLPDGTSTTSSFVDIPVTTLSKAEITLNQDSIPELKLDVNGDGVDDFTLGPNTDFDPIKYLQIMKITVDSLDLPQAKIKAFDNHIDKIIKAIEKGKIDKAKLTADKFKSFIVKKTAKVETESEFLLDMLNRLLVNLD